MNKTVKQEDIKEFAKTMKVGLVATIDDKGDPHITILSTLMAKTEKEMMLGEFVTGVSKSYMQKNPHCGFLIMNLEKQFWTGRMDWTRLIKEGEDYIMYNMQPKYRYNTYFGIHTVHYFNLLDISDGRKLDMGGIIMNALKVAIIKGGKKNEEKERVLKPWAFNLMKNMATLKYISYIDTEGYPRIIPVIQAQAATSFRLVLTAKPYGEELAAIPTGARVAVFGLNLDMENVLTKGTFSGFKSGVATVDIDRVYNSMPPKQGYIYDRAIGRP